MKKEKYVDGAMNPVDPKEIVRPNPGPAMREIEPGYLYLRYEDIWAIDNKTEAGKCQVYTRDQVFKVEPSKLRLL